MWNKVTKVLAGIAVAVTMLVAYPATCLADAVVFQDDFESYTPRGTYQCPCGT